MPYRWCPRCGKLFYCMVKQPTTCNECARSNRIRKKPVEHLKKLEVMKEELNKRLERKHILDNTYLYKPP